jgi:hypothetical protein
MALADVALVVTTGGVVISTLLNAAMWRRIGQMETAMKKICPWGVDGCPSFKRAAVEAAPPRDVNTPSIS